MQLKEAEPFPSRWSEPALQTHVLVGEAQMRGFILGGYMPSKNSNVLSLEGGWQRITVSLQPSFQPVICRPSSQLY